MKINLLDLFSGIGGFSLGLSNSGFEIENHFFSEVDNHAIAIYKKQFPGAKHVGPVEHIRAGKLSRVDAITFGSPCQDFSLAGKRAGLEGERSGLIQYAIELIREFRPKFFIWENVKGVFSSNAGADFWAVIQAFADIGGYRIEWQLLNTSWVLPQNRERVYLVGYIADGSGRSVFPIGEGDQINDAFRPKESVERPRVHCLSTRYGQRWTDESYIKPKIVQRPRYGKSTKESEICPTIEASRFEQKTHVKIGAMRGRNPENPKARQSGLKTEQMLEINENGTSNTLTSVQKDNLVVPYSKGGSKPGRSCINAGRVPEVGNAEKSIRRLTEIECERLQGFPDGWTSIGDYDGVIKPVSATQRYKCLGNAVTVPIVELVGKGLFNVLADSVKEAV